MPDGGESGSGVEGVDSEPRGLFSRDDGAVVYVWRLRNEPVLCGRGKDPSSTTGVRARSGARAEAARDWE